MKRQAPKILAFPDNPYDLPCPACEAPLEIHQPDRERPDRLLGVCLSCHGWASIRMSGDGRFNVTVLPDPG
jgi:hypothetical protein